MVWRAWSFVAGLPLGALAAWSLRGFGNPTVLLLLGALFGGGLMVALISWLARVRDDDPARGAHLAAATCVGYAALPALGAALWRLPPASHWLLAGCVVALALALVRGARARGPARGTLGRGLLGALWFVAGLVVTLGAAIGVAIWGGRGVLTDDRIAAAIYDIDATVATGEIPRCEPEAARVEVLLDRGARPRLERASGLLWFDAPDETGARQVHRLDPATGEITCFTCGEPGDNTRPSPGESGRWLVFETDRHARWWDPSNTEVHLLRIGSGEPGAASRRLTVAPGPDDHPLLAPGGAALVWSRRNAGQAVVRAQIQSGHGGVKLGPSRTLVRGGSEWVAPLAWSPDARSLVVARGNPFRPMLALRVDLATAESTELRADAADGAAFSADGGFAVVAGARRARVAGLLPRGLGGVLGPLATAAGRGGSLFRDTELSVGEPTGPRQDLALLEVAQWGEPTGVTMSADGTVLVVGQRRMEAGVVEERLLEIGLDCS